METTAAVTEATAGAGAEATTEATAEATPVTVKIVLVASVWLSWLKPQRMHNRVNRAAVKMQKIRPGSGGGGWAGARQLRQELDADRRGYPLPNRRMIQELGLPNAAVVEVSLGWNSGSARNAALPYAKRAPPSPSV